MDSRQATSGTTARLSPVIEIQRAKLLWDCKLYTDHVIEARQPDIIVVRKEDKKCLIIDIVVLGDVIAEVIEEREV